MDRSPPRRPAGRLPRGFLGMLALVILVEALLAGRKSDLTSDIATDWRWGAETARRDAPGSDVLFFGDSLVKFGVAPKLVEARSGRKAWNLAVFGGRPVNSYLLFKAALDAGARPSAVFVDGEMMHEAPFEIPYLWSELTDPVEAARLAWAGRDADFFARYITAWCLPSVRFRFEARARLVSALRGEVNHTRFTYNLNRRNWRFNRGASILPASRVVNPETLRHLEQPPVPTAGGWASHPLNTAYIDKFLDLAKGRGIRVFWLFPPRYRHLDRYFDQPNWGRRQRQFVRDRLDRYPNLAVIDGLHAEFPDDALADHVHLNRRGAEGLSLALGDILRDRLAPGAGPGPRWVDLPRFREPPADLPVEDLAQSIEASKSRR